MTLFSMFFKQSSIKSKVAYTTLLTLATVLLLSSMIFFFSARSILRDTICRQQYAMLRELAGEMQGRIQLASQQLSIIAASLTPEVLNNKPLLADILRHSGPAQALFDSGFLVIGTDGKVIAEEMGYPELAQSNLNFREYVKNSLKDGKPFISEPFRLVTPPHTPTIAFTYPVRDNNDRIFCILVGYHSLTDGQYLTSFSAEQIGSNAYLYILSGRTILMHHETSRIMENIAEGRNIGVDKALQGFEGSLDNVNSKGERLLSSFKKIDGTNWIMSANIPYKDAFMSLDSLLFQIAVVVLVAIGVSCLILWYVTLRLTKPVTTLIEHIDRHCNAEDEWQPLKLHTGDELERLADAYNMAMGEVQKGRFAVKEEKEFFGSIIQNAATPMFILDKNHKIIFWNNALAKLTGRSSFEMVGTKQQWKAFYDTKRPVMADLILENALKSQVDMLYEHNSSSRFTTGALKAEGWYEINGKRYYLFFEAAPVKNRGNEIIAAVETLEDITERKQMEERLSHLTRAMEQSPATIVMTDVQGNIEYVNPKFTEVTGYTASEAIGKNPRVLKSGEIDQSGYKDLWSTISAGKEWRGEFHNKRKDGSLYWEYASISPLFDAAGEISGYLAVKEDITARKIVEAELATSRQALEVSHEKLAQLFKQVSEGKREWEETLDCLNDFVMLTDPQHRVRRYNKLLADCTGKGYQELLGTDWRELLTEAGFVFVSFNGNIGELKHERSARVYDIKLYEIKNEDAVIALVVSLNDTTELRETTAELEKAYSELKEAQLQIYQQEKMASIGQLAAGVAHEINNPMGFINSNLGSLDKYISRINEYFKLLDDDCNMKASTLSDEIIAERKRLKLDRILNDAHELIVESQDGAARVRRIVADLKSFSRVDQAEQGLVNINEALETTINIAWNEIKYVADLERNFGEIPEILCYPQQLNQVFLNLLVNAAHALGSKHGIINVKTWQDEDNVCISVSDNGCGIAQENLTKIFEPFFTTKEVGKGTGLGLSISFDIIKKHGGTITVDSEIDIGTTFTVKLPVSGNATEQNQA